MDWIEVIGTAVTGILVSLTTVYLSKGSNQDISKNLDGEFELSMHKLYQITGYVSLLIAVVVIATVLFYQDEEMYAIVLPLLLVFGGLAIPCLMNYNNHKLIFNEEKIVVQNWRKEVKEISWSGISEIKFNPVSGYLKIKGLNKKIKIHQHLVGLKEFTKIMEQKTKWKARELKLPIK